MKCSGTWKRSDHVLAKYILHRPSLDILPLSFVVSLSYSSLYPLPLICRNASLSLDNRFAVYRANLPREIRERVISHSTAMRPWYVGETGKRGRTHKPD